MRLGKAIILISWKKEKRRKRERERESSQQKEEGKKNYLDGNQNKFGMNKLPLMVIT